MVKKSTRPPKKKGGGGSKKKKKVRVRQRTGSRPARSPRVARGNLNPTLLKRLAELNLDLTPLNEAMLEMFLELDRRHPKPAEAAALYQAAKTALTAEATRSDNPEEWIKAARKAAKLA
jgi:hypothetical protein